MFQPVFAAKKRAAETIKRIKAAEEASGELPQEVPYGQVRSMFQGRLQSIMLQNRKQCRQLFRKWDPQNQGNIPASRFHGALHCCYVAVKLCVTCCLVWPW